MKKKFKIHFKIKSKHTLAIMTFLCIGLIATVFASGISTAPLRNLAGYVVIPFENSINEIGKGLTKVRDSFRSKEDLMEENEKLRQQVASLTEQNNALVLDQSDLEDLRTMYELDQEYDEYPKVAAQVISKDPGNWYDVFVIDKGSEDGIQKDMNVIADRGLVGIVTEVGNHWATVRSIIDDSSNVSGQAVSTSDTCVVQGDLELIDEGKLRFSQMYDEEDEIQEGERIVTSNISDKYVEGLFIGYVSEVEMDSNNLTKTGTIVSPVDFAHLKNVLVITTLKEGQEDSNEE